MAGQCQRQIIACDAVAVVGDTDQLDAPFLELDTECASAGIDGVLQ